MKNGAKQFPKRVLTVSLNALFSGPEEVVKSLVILQLVIDLERLLS